MIKATKAEQEEITTTVKSSTGIYSLSISPRYIKISMKEEKKILENITVVELSSENNIGNDIKRLIQEKLSEASELPDFFRVAKKCLILRRGQRRKMRTEKIMTLERKY